MQTPLRLRPGISSFAFGWATSPAPGETAFDADALLDFALEHGAEVIQFGDNLPLHPLSEAELDRIARRANAAGVAIETGARGLTPEHLARYLRLSRQLGARLLRFVIDARGHEPAPEHVVEIVRAALPELAAAGVVLGLENHDRFSSAQLRRMIDSLASPHVGVCLDTANSFGAGEGISEVLRELAPVCVNLHLKDFAIERLPYLMGFTISGRSLGEGMLPIEAVLDAVRASGRCTTAVIETWPPPESDRAATLAKERAWAVASLGALRRRLRS